MTKAGISSAAMADTWTHVDFDDLEVSFAIITQNLALILICLCSFLKFCLNLMQIKLGELEAELVEVNANNEKLQRTYNELLEYKLVLQKVRAWCICA